MLDGYRGAEQLLRELAQPARRVDAARSSRRSFERAVNRGARLAGVSRLADISWLSPSGLDVFQATRPDPYSHVFFGQNSGSQGKGRSARSARLAALLEALEGYSAEPRHADLVRGSYDFLRHTQPIIHPLRYRQPGARRVSSTEPIMWTRALCLKRQIEVLVPAEAVYFPFFPTDYETRTVCPTSSTGLGAGVNLLRAILHGLHEVVERDYRARLKRVSADLVVERVRGADVEALPLLRRLLREHADLSPCVYAVRRRAAPMNGPLMIAVCLLPEEGEPTCGFASDFSALRGIERAFTEAVQSFVTGLSAAREDTTVRRLGEVEPDAARIPPQPDHGSGIPEITLESLCDRGRDDLADPESELSSLVEFVASLGWHDVLVKDLTRVGIDVPVVRVVVPGAQQPEPPGRETYRGGQSDVTLCRFSLDFPEVL